MEKPHEHDPFPGIGGPMRGVFSLEELIFMQQAAGLYGLKLAVVTNPGEEFLTSRGYTYNIGKRKVGLELHNPSNNGLGDFWETVETLKYLSTLL